MRKQIFEGASTEVQGIPCLTWSDDWDGYEVDFYWSDGAYAKELQEMATAEDLRQAREALWRHVSDAVLDAMETRASTMVDYRYGRRL